MKLSRQNFIEWGRKGGKVKSDKKTNSCRLNARHKRKRVKRAAKN